MKISKDHSVIDANKQQDNLKNYKNKKEPTSKNVLKSSRKGQSKNYRVFK